MGDQLDDSYFHFLTFFVDPLSPAPWSLSEGYCFLIWFHPFTIIAVVLFS